MTPASTPPPCTFPDCRCDTASGRYACETMPHSRAYLARPRDRLRLLLVALAVVGAFWGGFLCWAAVR